MQSLLEHNEYLLLFIRTLKNPENDSSIVIKKYSEPFSSEKRVSFFLLKLLLMFSKVFTNASRFLLKQYFYNLIRNRVTGSSNPSRT